VYAVVYLECSGPGPRATTELPYSTSLDYDDDDDNYNKIKSLQKYLETMTTLNRFPTKNCHTRNITRHKESATS
jgi:hypothetical protein